MGCTFNVIRRLSHNPIISARPGAALARFQVLCSKQSSASVSPSDALQGALGGAEGCHCTRGPSGRGLDHWRGCLVTPVPLSQGGWDNAAVNTPDGDLWVLWKFNVTLRATCSHRGQRWARSGSRPRPPCVGELETKRQTQGGPRQSLDLFCSPWHW